MMRDWTREKQDIQNAREEAARYGGHSREEAEALWKQAARTAAVCAECFEPLAPNATVTMAERRIGRHYSLRVPICLLCWLLNVQRKQLFHLDRIQRCRCENCSRPMRVYRGLFAAGTLGRTARCCCDDCRRLMLNARASERRRVHHDPIACEVCGENFVPTRADARTCSNKCRQAAFRRRA
jgi:hypothetical protein